MSGVQIPELLLDILAALVGRPQPAFYQPKALGIIVSEAHPQTTPGSNRSTRHSQWSRPQLSPGLELEY